MPTTLFVATAVGLVVAVPGPDRWVPAETRLAGTPLTSVLVLEGTVLAGGPGGLLRTTDGGATWQRVVSAGPGPHIRRLGRAADAATLLAGTEPAGLLVSRDGGLAWTLRPEVERLRDRHGWYLPYSPEAGCVRGFAAGPAGGAGSRLFAAVEVGGVLVSDDGGDSWRLATGSDGSPEMDRDLGRGVHPDVHDLAVDPVSPRRVAAATGGGVYDSTDGGATWRRRHPSYTRAIWIDPGRPGRIVAGPADGVARNGRIEVSDDGGESWRPWNEGTDAPWPRHMVDRFAAVGSDLMAVLSNGELWSAPAGGGPWRRLLPETPGIRDLAASP